MTEPVEFTRLDALMNVAAFFNTHFTMVGLIGPWIFVGLSNEIVFGDVTRCIIFDGDSFSLFDTVCSTDIQTVEKWMVPIQYSLIIAFVCALNAFVISNWALANNFAEKALPVLSLGSFVGSLVAWALWVSGSPVDLPGPDQKVYFIGVGLYFTIMGSIMSFGMLVISLWRLIPNS